MIFVFWPATYHQHYWECSRVFFFFILKNITSISFAEGRQADLQLNQASCIYFPVGESRHENDVKKSNEKKRDDLICKSKLMGFRILIGDTSHSLQGGRFNKAKSYVWVALMKCSPIILIPEKMMFDPAEFGCWHSSGKNPFQLTIWLFILCLWGGDLVLCLALLLVGPWSQADVCIFGVDG